MRLKKLEQLRRKGTVSDDNEELYSYYKQKIEEEK